MSKYAVLPESTIRDLRTSIESLMVICKTIIQHLDSESGTLDFDRAKPSAGRKEEKKTPKKKRSGNLMDALLAHVPNEPFSPRQALESISEHYKFRGKKGRGIDSVRHALRAGKQFVKLEDGRYQRKEFKLDSQQDPLSI